MGGHTAAVRVLLEEGGASPQQGPEMKHTAIRGAAIHGHTGIIRMLLHHGAEADVKSRSGLLSHLQCSLSSFNARVGQLAAAGPLPYLCVNCDATSLSLALRCAPSAGTGGRH